MFKFAHDEYDRMSQRLETMNPDPDYDADAHADAIEVLGRDEYTFKIWGGDWCGDCQGQLPQFGAALDAAGVPADRIEHYPVEKADDGSKIGPKVEAYDIELIPTVVVERDGTELGRFVEDEELPIAEYLADQLAEVEASA
jgi:thiol-disulfide isomerase/thioredoxin